MGKPLLNVSTAATAFYKPGMSVAQFMREFCNIGPWISSFTATDLKNLRAALKGVRVEITHEERTKTITDVANLDMTPSSVNFVDANNTSWTVASHLTANRSK
jgi:hypothetical protein